MNMKSIFNFVVEALGLFASWLSFGEKEWAWCPIRVNNRIEK